MGEQPVTMKDVTEGVENTWAETRYGHSTGSGGGTALGWASRWAHSCLGTQQKTSRAGEALVGGDSTVTLSVHQEPQRQTGGPSIVQVEEEGPPVPKKGLQPWHLWLLQLPVWDV